MDKLTWIDRFLARVRSAGPPRSATELALLAEDPFELGGHISPELVARIELDIAHRATWPGRVASRPGTAECRGAAEKRAADSPPRPPDAAPKPEVD